MHQLGVWRDRADGGGKYILLFTKAKGVSYGILTNDDMRQLGRSLGTCDPDCTES